MVGVECQASGTPILVSSEVTEETACTFLMEFESLSSSPEVWAKHLRSLSRLRAAATDLDSLKKFDIRIAASGLVERYESLFDGGGASNDS